MILNPDWNPWGYDFEQHYYDPVAHVRVDIQHQLYRKQYMSKFCDEPSDLPEVWEVGHTLHNVYDAAGFGCKIDFPENQIPSTEPFESEDDIEAMMDQDIANPLSYGYWKERVEFDRELGKVIKGMTFEGRPVKYVPMVHLYTDGPMTVACNLRGSDFMMDLIAEPEKADRLMRFIVDAVIYRRKAMRELNPEHPGYLEFLADDSIQMIGTELYEERIMSLHDELYEDALIGAPANTERMMHLCGDATRHYPTIAKGIGVSVFDTGFPVDHGKLREQLGPDVLIQGGTSVDVLAQGSPEDVFNVTANILNSGIKQGGRFHLREGNNLPPGIPEDNLSAMYQACLEHGHIDEH